MSQQEQHITKVIHDTVTSSGALNCMDRLPVFHAFMYFCCSWLHAFCPESNDFYIADSCRMVLLLSYQRRLVAELRNQCDGLLQNLVECCNAINDLDGWAAKEVSTLASLRKDALKNVKALQKTRKELQDRDIVLIDEFRKAVNNLAWEELVHDDMPDPQTPNAFPNILYGKQNPKMSASWSLFFPGTITIGESEYPMPFQFTLAGFMMTFLHHMWSFVHISCMKGVIQYRAKLNQHLSADGKYNGLIANELSESVDRIRERLALISSFRSLLGSQRDCYFDDPIPVSERSAFAKIWGINREYKFYLTAKSHVDLPLVQWANNLAEEFLLDREYVLKLWAQYEMRHLFMLLIGLGNGNDNMTDAQEFMFTVLAIIHKRNSIAGEKDWVDFYTFNDESPECLISSDLASWSTREDDQFTLNERYMQLQEKFRDLLAKKDMAANDRCDLFYGVEGIDSPVQFTCATTASAFIFFSKCSEDIQTFFKQAGVYLLPFATASIGNGKKTQEKDEEQSNEQPSQ